VVAEMRNVNAERLAAYTMVLRNSMAFPSLLRLLKRLLNCRSLPGNRAIRGLPIFARVALPATAARPAAGHRRGVTVYRPRGNLADLPTGMRRDRLLMRAPSRAAAARRSDQTPLVLDVNARISSGMVGEALHRQGRASTERADGSPGDVHAVQVSRFPAAAAVSIPAEHAIEPSRSPRGRACTGRTIPRGRNKDRRSSSAPCTESHP